MSFIFLVHCVGFISLNTWSDGDVHMLAEVSVELAWCVFDPPQLASQLRVQALQAEPVPEPAGWKREVIFQLGRLQPSALLHERESRWKSCSLQMIAGAKRAAAVLLLQAPAEN